MVKSRIYSVSAILLILLAGRPVTSQSAAPDTILFNAKVVTMDDSGFTSDTGNILQALAISSGKIVAVGENSQIQSLAGPDTVSHDLTGRTVLPGLIGVHEHPYDWTLVNPYILRKVLTDQSIVTRIVDGSPEDQLKTYPSVLREATTTAKPGQWIYLVFTLGKNYEYSSRGNAGLGGIPGQYPVALFGAGTGRPPLVARAQLDVLAPNHPVLIRDTFTQLVLNTKGLAEIGKVFPEDITSQINHENGIGGADPIRWVFTDVVMQDFYDELREMTRLGLNWWAGYGMTTFASAAYSPSNIRVFNDLSRSGQMWMRNMWTWNWRNYLFVNDNYLLDTLLTLEGRGNDYFWNGGAFLATGLGCSSLTPLVQLPDSQTRCGLAPGSREYEVLFRFVRQGGRFTTGHFTLDGDVDNLLDLIEKASPEGGFTLDEIRSRRHTFDHIPMLRTDQLERVKKLGMVPGGNTFEVYQSSPGVLKVYGEKAVEWVVPKKALVDAEIPSGFEIDRALESTNLSAFWALARFINREAWDGKVYGQSQKLSRELALKTATVWGAYYLAKEDVLGSLEPGKWADLIVLDRDYMSVPESDIPNVRILMSMVGGQIAHLVPSLAREIGLKPTGAQVELGGPAAGW